MAVKRKALKMIELFSYAFILGLLFNAAPGAILAESLRQGLKGGFAPALAVQIGSLVGDALWVILGLLGAAALITIPSVSIPLMLSGAVLLCYLAYQSIRDSRQPMPPPSTNISAKQSKGAMATGVLLSISNPLNIAYWAALGGTIAAVSNDNPTAIDFAIFIGGFMLSSVLWCFIAAGIIAYTRSRLTSRLWQMLNFGCGIGLLLMAIFVVRNLMTHL